MKRTASCLLVAAVCLNLRGANELPNYVGNFAGDGSGLTNLLSAGVPTENGFGTNISLWINPNLRTPYWIGHGIGLGTAINLYELHNGDGTRVLLDDPKNGASHGRILYWGGCSYDAQSFRVQGFQGGLPRFTFAFMDQTDNTEITTVRIYTNYLSFGPDGGDFRAVTFNSDMTEIRIGDNIPMHLDSSRQKWGHAQDTTWSIDDAIITLTNSGVKQLSLDVETDLDPAGLTLHHGAFRGNGICITNIARTNLVGPATITTPRPHGTYTNTSQIAFVSYQLVVAGDPDLIPTVSMVLKVTAGGATNTVARCGAVTANADLYFTMSGVVGPNERTWVEEETTTKSYHVTGLSVTKF